MTKKEEKKSLKSRILFILYIIVAALLGFFGAYYLLEHWPDFNFFDFIIILAVLIMSFPLHIVLHEVGHLIGGFLSGYEFIMFRLFNTVWIKTEHGISKRKQVVQGILGQALMMPPKDTEEPPFLLYHSSGLLINLLVGILFIIIGSQFSNSAPALAFYVSAGVSLFLFFTNVIPMQPNDGYNIREHYRRPETLKELTNMLYLYAGMVKGESFVDLQRYIDLDAINLKENLNGVTLYNAQAAAHLEVYDFAAARDIYQSLWNHRNTLLEPHKAGVYFSYLFTLLLTEPEHPDIAQIQATKIYENYREMKMADVLRVRAAEALYLEINPEQAQILLSEGAKFIQWAPTIAEENLEAKLYTYLKKIRSFYFKNSIKI